MKVWAHRLRDPYIILDILRKRSIKTVEVDNLYPLLYKESLYILAYEKLSKNPGILTSAVTGETVDGISLHKIWQIIEDLKFQRYKWHKSRVFQSGMRKLSICEWQDKLLQKVIALILGAIYEPRFSNASHGFRPNLGCHSALIRVQRYGQACEFFIQGDIEDCFNAINHQILIQILRKTIKDNRLIQLIQGMLTAGKLELDFVYGKTYSGIAQGGSLSSLLVNIYLNELDNFIESEIKPLYHNDLKREESKEYRKIRGKISNEQKKLMRQNPRISREESLTRLKSWRKQLRSMPFTESIDVTKSRRFCYTRYADDWIITFTGTFKEANEILHKIVMFLDVNLKLSLSQEKTRIVRSNNEKSPARFLGYNLITQWSNDKITDGSRSLIGTIAFLIPNDVIIYHKAKFMKNGKVVHLPQYLANPTYDIIASYQARFRGLCQYYKFARNQQKLAHMKYIMEISLTKTLACKLKTSVAKVYKRFASMKMVDGYNYKVIAESIVDGKGNTHTAYFGAIPFKRQPFSLKNIIRDDIHIYYYGRNSMMVRLSNNICELCGSEDAIEIHHIHHMKDVSKSKSEFAKRMIAMNRKTIAVCQRCHNMIHNGSYSSRKLS